MEASSLATPYADVSLFGRLAVALRCFERYCAVTGILDPGVSALVEHLWQLPVAMREGRFNEWFEARPPLFDFDPAERENKAVLQALPAAVSPNEFTALVQSVVEVVFGSFYGASDDTGSQQELASVLRLVAARGVHPLAPSAVAGSRFADGQGWGAPIDDATLERWRTAPDAG